VAHWSSINQLGNLNPVFALDLGGALLAIDTSLTQSYSQ
jgi:hypothetical protein